MTADGVNRKVHNTYVYCGVRPAHIFKGLQGHTQVREHAWSEAIETEQKREWAG